MSNKTFDPFDTPYHGQSWNDNWSQEAQSIKLDPSSLFNYLKPKWKVEFIPNWFIHTPKDCNWFHRLMQRLILGFKWTKLDHN